MKKINKGEDDAATYVRQMRDSFTKMLHYVLQLLPPTAMLLLQVRVISHFHCICSHLTRSYVSHVYVRF